VGYIQTLEQKDRLWQPNFKGDIKGNTEGYRGDFILIPGETIADRQMPPKLNAKQVIMYVVDEKIELLCAYIPTVANLEKLYELLGDAMKPEGKYFIYTDNADKTMTAEYNGCAFHIFQLDESTVWNETLDLASLSKGDMKNLDNGEKIIAIYDELKRFKGKEVISFEEAKKNIFTVEKVKVGAV